MRLPRFRRLSLAASLLVGLVIASAAIRADTGRPTFTDSLSASERAAAGLDKLEPAQLAALNLQIERELTLARDGNVRGFAGSFSQRRRPDDLAASGLGLLDPVERARIDAHVAHRMSNPTFTYWPVRSRGDGQAETVSQRPEIHGSFTLFYGTGGGMSHRGGAMTMTYDDPARNLSVSVTYSEVHTKGSPGRYVTRRSRPDVR